MEYDYIFKKYFTNKNINLFRRINYLNKNNLDIIQNKEHFFNCYNNSISKIENQFYFNGKIIQDNKTDIINVLYDEEFNTDNITDIYNKYLLQNDTSFLINFMFKKYISTYYDYMKNNNSNHGLIINNYNLKDWYILRKDYEGKSLRIIINTDNIFYNYLFNNFNDELIDKEAYEFSLRRSLLFLPVKQTENDNIIVHRNFTTNRNNKKIFNLDNINKINLLDSLKNNNINTCGIFGYVNEEENYKELSQNTKYHIENIENRMIINNKFYELKSNEHYLSQYIINISKNYYNNFYENIKNEIVLPCRNYSDDIVNHKKNCKYCSFLNDKDFLYTIQNINKKKNEYNYSDLDNIFTSKDLYDDINSNIRYLKLYNENIDLQDENIDLQDENIDSQNENIDLQTKLIELQKESIESKKENTDSQNENIKILKLFIKIQKKKFKNKLYVFENYLNIKKTEKESALTKDENGVSIGKVSLEFSKKRKKILNIIKKINYNLESMSLSLIKLLENNSKNTTTKINYILKKFNFQNIDEMIIKWNIIKENIYNTYDKCEIRILEKKIKYNKLLNYRDANNNNIFHYILFYNRINLFMEMYHFINFENNNNNRNCFNTTIDDLIDYNFFNVNLKNINNNDNERNNEELNSINICSLSINIDNYYKLIDNITQKFEKNKDTSLNFIDKDLYKKTILKDLIQNEGWGYEKNYYNENIWFKNNTENIIENKYTMSEDEDYPIDVLYNSINLYYDYLSNHHETILKKIKNKKNSIYQRMIYEISIKEENLSSHNIDFNTNDIENIQKILKILERIYNEYQYRYKKGIHIDKDTIDNFRRYLLDYRKDKEGNIIGSSNYDYLQNCHFYFLTRFKENISKNNFMNHPLCNKYNIDYFFDNITIIDAMTIIENIFITINNKNIIQYTNYLFRNLYIKYKDLNNLYHSNNIQHTDKKIFNTKFIDYEIKNTIFDIPKKFIIQIDQDNIDIVYDLINEYSFYHFYIEFKYFIVNLLKNNLNDLKDTEYNIDYNEWKLFTKNNKKYFIHNKTQKIYLNVIPNNGIDIFTIQKLYEHENVMNIFTKIIYGYNFDYLVKLEKFQDFMWEKKNNNYYNSKDLIEINMTNEELDFIYECLDFLKTNPRKIKRILNIISLTRYIIDNKQLYQNDIDKDLIYKLIIKFVILYEQWPYRTTWLSIWIKECYEIINYDNFDIDKKKSKWFPEKLFDEIKNYKQNFEGDNYMYELLKKTSLNKMYEMVENYIFSSDKIYQLSKMDCDPDIFSQFLEFSVCKTDKNKKCIWNCLDMLNIEKLNFNHNPAIYETCIIEINKLQINKKYNVDTYESFIRKIDTTGFPVRNVSNANLENKKNTEKEETDFTLFIPNDNYNDDNIKIVIG